MALQGKLIVNIYGQCLGQLSGLSTGTLASSQNAVVNVFGFTTFVRLHVVEKEGTGA